MWTIPFVILFSALSTFAPKLLSQGPLVSSKRRANTLRVPTAVLSRIPQIISVGSYITSQQPLQQSCRDPEVSAVEAASALHDASPVATTKDAYNLPPVLSLSTLFTPKSSSHSDSPQSATPSETTERKHEVDSLNTHANVAQLDELIKDSPSPTQQQHNRHRSESRVSIRPQSMVQTHSPVMMDNTGDILPELQPIFSFLNSHSNKLYQEGYFLKLHDLDTRELYSRPVIPERMLTVLQEEDLAPIARGRNASRSLQAPCSHCGMQQP